MDVNDFLLPIVKNEIRRARHPSGSRAPNLYPSSASVLAPSGKVLGGCHRADWYRIHKVEPTNAAEFYMEMVYTLGKAIELKFVDGMKCAGIYESSGVRFYIPEFRLSGELDIVGRYRPTPDTVGYYLVEVKSVYGLGVQKTITGRTRAYKGQKAFDPYPKESNIMQVMLYTDHFDGVKTPGNKLDFSKLIYLPRDNPSDGREYTVSLITKADLNESLLLQYGDLMADGYRYALVQTKGFPDKIETRFSLEEIYRRYSEFINDYLLKGIPPPRSYSKFLSEQEIEEDLAEEELSASMYDKWVKAGKPKSDLAKTPGHFLCQSYCEFRDFCWDKKGNPNPEADLVGLVQIEERANEESRIT